MGLNVVAESLRAAGGADASGAIDLPAAYVKIMPRDNPAAAETFCWPASSGTRACSRGSVTIGPRRSWRMDVHTRCHCGFAETTNRTTLTLRDVVKDDYLGTDTPRDYSSYVDLDDPSQAFHRDNIRIWMNNPLRYAGQTFYQSGFNQLPDGTRQTTLQVVTNTGWMIPYLACMLVATGLLAHFWACL